MSKNNVSCVNSNTRKIIKLPTSKSFPVFVLALRDRCGCGSRSRPKSGQKRGQKVRALTEATPVQGSNTAAWIVATLRGVENSPSKIPPTRSQVAYSHSVKRNPAQVNTCHPICRCALKRLQRPLLQYNKLCAQ